MYAHVDELYPHQTHFSIPFTMVVVWKYPFVCAFLKCHFESVWPVSNGLRQRFSVGSQTIHLLSQHPFFTLAHNCPPFFLLGIHTTIRSHSIWTHFSFRCLNLQSRALLCPSQIALASFWNDMAVKMPFFCSCLVVCTTMLKWGKVAHLIFCFFFKRHKCLSLYAYSPIICI